MIGQYYGIGVSCNVCYKQAPLITVDMMRYRWGPGQEGNAAYIKYIQERASGAAKSDGFVELDMENNVPNDGNPLTAAGNTRHVCADCINVIRQLK